jgi:GT2 family glycosyltransferase
MSTHPPDELRLNTAARSGGLAALTVLIPFLRDDPTPLLRDLDREGAKGVAVILLDDGGGDAALTLKVTETIAQMRTPAMHIVGGRNRGRAAGRNLLLRFADSPYVLLIDADMRPVEADFLARWMAAAKDFPAAAFGGFAPGDDETAQDGALHRFMTARSDCAPAAEREVGGARFVTTANLLIRRDVAAMEPFDEGFKGWGLEDTEWAVRAARHGRILHVDNPALHLGHDPPDTLLAKARQFAANYPRFALKHPDVAARMAAYRAGRALRFIPGHGLARPLLAWAARDPLKFVPLAWRSAALKLYRASHIARALQNRQPRAS